MVESPGPTWDDTNTFKYADLTEEQKAQGYRTLGFDTWHYNNADPNLATMRTGVFKRVDGVKQWVWPE